MFSKILSKRSNLAAQLILVIGVVAFTLSVYQPAQAHCDSEKGPVAIAAHQALESGNVNLILPYVQPEAESELIASFKQTRDVRKVGGKTQALADQYFVETAIRLHRVGEGAAYTGVSDEAVPMSIQVADRSMASGSVDETYKLLNQELQKGLQEKYEAVVTAREDAKHLGTVEAQRERVEAELTFEKYVYEVYTLITAEAPHAEGHTH